MPFDAFLLQSFGGPNSRADVIPFLENVTRGRNIPPQRLLTVAKQYELFDGKSPINEINLGIIERLRTAFALQNISLPIYFGNRNYEPFVEDALRQMANDGRKNAIAFVTSAYGSFSSCMQYKLDISMAQKSIGENAPNVTKIRHFNTHQGFIKPLIKNIVKALDELPGSPLPHLVFSAHSIPLKMAATSPYLEQLETSRQLVLQGVSEIVGKTLESGQVFQSRSGPPNQPWLEPDILDYLYLLSQQNVQSAVIVPIGFVSDHMEVIYDLDTLALKKANELGINALRVETSSASSEFIDMIVDLTNELLNSYTEPKFISGTGYLNGCTQNCCPEN